MSAWRLTLPVLVVMTLLPSIGRGPTLCTSLATAQQFPPAELASHASPRDGGDPLPDHALDRPGALHYHPSPHLTIVRLSKPDYRPIASVLDPSLFVDYDSFVWLGLDEEHLAVLRHSQIDFSLERDATLLFLNRFRFDPLLGEPLLPAAQQTRSAGREQGFYVVQFVGPTKEEWLTRLRGTGAVLIQFQPNYAYIVRMSWVQAVAVRHEPFVRWVGMYHAAYRIAPSLLVPTPHQIIRNVDITLYNDGRVADTLAAITRLGGQLIQHFPAQPDGSLMTAIFALPARGVVRVAQLRTVLWMNFSSPTPHLLDEVSDQIVVGQYDAGGVPFTGYSDWLAHTGVDGAGVIVADVDTGMDTNDTETAHPDIRGRIAAFVAYPGAPDTDTDGHGTHTGGIIAGNAAVGTLDSKGFRYGVGVAPQAQLVVQNGLHPKAACCPPPEGWQQFSRDSVIHGAVASNNSWTADGLAGYSAATRTHDIMVRDADFTTATIAEPLIMVFAAGNFGPMPMTIPEPQEAKNIITVGASENFRDDPWVEPGIGCGSPSDINAVAAFSSRGPAKDGRMLPHMTAPGTFIVSMRSGTGTSYGAPFCATIIDENYVWDSGTSMAAPHVTGGVALITQWWGIRFAGRTPSPALAKALLINGAVDMGEANIPNNAEGWGRVNLHNVINPPVNVLYRDQATIFHKSGDTWSLEVIPHTTGLPLKVTLVWTDAPGAGSGGATKALVNDLDLTVTQHTPTSVHIFRGNRGFVGGWSTPAMPGEEVDRAHNIENVYIAEPHGVHVITVSAHNIGQDAIGIESPFKAKRPEQDFALVCYNCLGFSRAPTEPPLPQ